MALVTKNTEGIYGTVSIYKNKKEATPLVVCQNGKMVYNVIDEVIDDEKTYVATRHYKVMTMEPDGSAVKMTVAEYYLPNGDCIQGEGIEANYELEFDSELYKKDGTDNQLQKAIEVIEGK